MSWTRLLVANVVVLLVMLLVLEFGARVAWTIQQCVTATCSFDRLTGLEVRAQPVQANLGLTRFDAALGYVPTEGFDARIDAPGWDKARLTITAEGFRANDNAAAAAPRKGRILAVGDSFTFGDEVPNSDTWPACLEREANYRVDNAGVYGYGAAQAVKRADGFVRRFPYDVVILSILVGHDLERDRLVYRSGFAKPALIESNGRIQWSAVPDPKRPGTVWNPAPGLATLPYRYSQIAAYFFDRLGISAWGNALTEEHPNAVTEEEVLAWTLDELVALDVPRKILLLQYGGGLSRPVIQEERRELLAAADERGLPVVDTYEPLAAGEAAMLWRGHHTALGNQVVCRQLANALTR